MATDHEVLSVDVRPRTRRALLGAAAGAVGASVIGAVALPRVARAGSDNGEPILVGSQFVDVQALTLLQNNSNNNAGVFAAASNGGGTALHASSGSGLGVYGQSTSGTGVAGFSVAATAVSADSLTGTAFRASVPGATGLAVNATASHQNGIALRAVGRVQLQSVSAVAIIPSGATSVLVSPTVNVTGDSFVLLTPQVNLGGRDLWFTTDPAANTFRIRISSPRNSITRISWLLLE